MPAFDTLQFAQDLQRVFTPEQAEALAKAISQHAGEDLATRSDLTQLQEATKRNLTQLQERIDFRLENLETSLRQEIKDRVAEAKIDFIRWMVGAMAVNLLGVAGLMITLIKIIPR